MAELEGLSPELADQMSRAEDFAGDAKLLGAAGAAFRDEDAFRQAEADAAGFLRERGVEIPDGLDVRFLRDPFEYPGPDYEFFTIRFTRCRTYWVKKQNAPGYEQVTVCFGFEIIPHPISPIG